MNTPHHQDHFDYAFPIYYTRLKVAYQDGVKSAVNKEYAAEYFHTVLFEENEAIPARTFFYNGLRNLYNHFENLYGASAVVRTMEHLDAIRQQSREAMEHLERFRDGWGEPDFGQLPEHYDWQIDYGASASEIIEEEKQVLALSDRQVVELLALHSAIRKLSAELRPGTTLPGSEGSESEPEGDRKDRFKRSQQVLVFHFLLEATGINHNGANITDCARLLHKLIGVPEPKDIANSDLYKKLKNPTGDYDRNTLLHLRAILPYFEKLPHYPIMKMINDHIRSCDGD